MAQGTISGQAHRTHFRPSAGATRRDAVDGIIDLGGAPSFVGRSGTTLAGDRALFLVGGGRLPVFCPSLRFPMVELSIDPGFPRRVPGAESIGPWRRPFAAPLERRLGEIAGNRPDHLDEFAWARPNIQAAIRDSAADIDRGRRAMWQAAINASLCRPCRANFAVACRASAKANTGGGGRCFRAGADIEDDFNQCDL